MGNVTSNENMEYRKAISSIAEQAIKSTRLPVQYFSWYQINMLVTEIEQKNGYIKYLGEVRDKRTDKMSCVFQEYQVSSTGKVKKGSVYVVENDVVFKFQEDGKPVERM